MGIVATSFQREAAPVLKDAGYVYVRHNSSAHAIWSKKGAPDIHVPGSPSGGRDAMLARIRRAVRKRTPLNPPSGVITDMPKTPDTSQPDRLVKLAPLYLHRKAAEQKRRRETGDKTPRTPDPQYAVVMGEWMRACIERYGCLDNRELNAAAKTLELEPWRLSIARAKAQATAFSLPGRPKGHTLTDFIGRVPSNAVMAGGRKIGTEIKARTAPPEPRGVPDFIGDREVVTQSYPPESPEVADHGVQVAKEEPAAAPNGNGRTSQLDYALELLREAALADTHALTDADMTLLRGHREIIRRMSDELVGVAASLNNLLDRVEAKTPVEA